MVVHNTMGVVVHITMGVFVGQGRRAVGVEHLEQRGRDALGQILGEGV